MKTTTHSFHSIFTLILLSPFLAFAQPTASNPLPVNIECIGDVPSPDPLVVTDETDIIGIPSVLWEEDVSDGLTCPETITRYYKVTGDGGNFIFVNQTITVNDVTNPTASNPLPVNVECIGDVPANNITDVTDEADNCTVVPVVAFVSEVSDGASCPETITRTYSVTDDCGNQILVTQTIIVNDVTIPTASNPTTINLPGGSFAPAPDVSVVIDEADNCSSIPVVTFVSDVSDGLSDPETITRTYCITDDCGNQNCVSQLIIISANVGIEEVSATPKELVKIVDLMGRETIPQKNSVSIYVYSDGSTQRIFEFE